MRSPEPEWTRPGAHTVVPGILRIPLTLPNDALRAVNVYALEEHDGLTLIDGGMSTPTARAEIESALRSRGYALDDISRVLVTHVHRDHYTNAVSLRRETQCRVGLGKREERGLQLTMDRERPRFAEQLALLRSHGASELADSMAALSHTSTVPRNDWQEPDWWISDGDVIDVGSRSVRAKATPGHTRGHKVFIDDHLGVTFTGDHLLPSITPSVALEPEPQLDSLHHYLDSLRQMTEAPDSILLPAHGPVAPSVHERAVQLLEHHENRLQQIVAAVERRQTTAVEVAHAVSWTRHNVAIATLNTFNQMLAVLEVIYHLEELARRGLVRRCIETDSSRTVGYERHTAA